MFYQARRILAGNVGGQLLSIPTRTMLPDKPIQAHKNNLKSLCLHQELLLTAGQDKRLTLWGLHTLAQLRSRANVHTKAFSILGVRNEVIFTVSWTLGELKAWKLDTLEQTGSWDIPKCLAGEGMVIPEGLLFCTGLHAGLHLLPL